MSGQRPKQIREFEDEVPSSNERWTKLGKPSLEDFKEERVAVRSELVTRILKELESKRFCVILGPRDSGKTWLCRAVAFELWKQERPIRFVELDHDFDPYEIWTYIKGIPSCSFIVENCHIRKDLVADLANKIFAQPENRRFIFTACDAKALSILKGEAFWIQLKTGSEETAKHIKDIIEKFVEVEKVREWVEVTDGEIEATVEKWKDGNLSDVYVLLSDGWHFRKRMKLTAVGDKNVFESMLDVDGKMKLGRPERRDIFLALSAICQFESAQVWDEYLQRIDKGKVLYGLENEGLIDRNRWRGNSFFSIETNRAGRILRAIAYQKGCEYVHKEVMKTCKEYLKLKPPNWSYVLYCLRVSKEAPLLVKDIPYGKQLPPVEPLIVSRGIAKPVDEFLYSIFEDQETWNALEEMIEANYYFSLSLLPSLSKTLIAAYQREKERNVVESHLRKDADQILHELRRCEISTINGFLSFLWKRNWIRFKEVVKKIDVRSSELARYEESAFQSKCTLCFIISHANIQMSKLIVEDMQRQLKESTANNVRGVLRNISGIRKVISIEDFFDPFTTSDWERIIMNTALLTTIFNLLRDFSKIRHLPKVAERLARAILKCDLMYLVNQKDADLYRLNGIIRLAYELDVPTKNMDESILEADLNTLKYFHTIWKRREAKAGEQKLEVPKGGFLAGLSGIADIASHRAETEPEISGKIGAFISRLAKFETEDLRMIFSDIHSVNFFMSHPATKAEDSCQSIIKKIGADTWLDLIHSALRDEKTAKKDAFWLLWNIYRYNKRLAKKLAQKSVELYSKEVREGDLSEVALPLIGLLNDLKINTVGFFHEIDLKKASEIIDYYRSYKPPDCTLILLSLVAVRSAALGNKFNALKEKTMKDPNLRKYLYDNPNEQLHKVFSDIIARYGF